MKTKTLIGAFICAFLLLSACTAQPVVVDAGSQPTATAQQAKSAAQKQEMLQETAQALVSGIREINYTTDDAIVISGTFYPGTGQDGVILIHMLGNDRTSWGKLPEALNNEGLAVLAIDLRGHGKSMQETGEYTTFTALNYQHMLYDIKGAKQFFRKKGLTGSVSLVGASIGANLALTYAAEDTEIKNIVLLSPGENYRGILTMVPNEQYRGKMLLVSSENDISSYAATSTLSKRANGIHAFHSYATAGHGTDMLKESDLIPTIVDWLKK